MKKLFLLGFAAICMMSCNSNADTNTKDDSTSTMTGGDTVSSGSSAGSMNGTGTDTGYHGAGMDSSRMSSTDTTRK